MNVQTNGLSPFIGTKRINAKPMSRKEYNDLRGWIVPVDENPNDEGYLVEYADSDSNLAGFDGYVSWSPKAQFEATYQPLDAMSFGHAVDLLKDGCTVARKGWNGKGMYLVLISGSAVKQAIHESYNGSAENEPLTVLDAIYMYTADGKLVPWLASQMDVLADDWVLRTCN